MANKKRSKLLAAISLPLLIFLAQFFSLKDLLEKYSDLEFARRKEHSLKSVKPPLPSHGLEKIFQIFIITTRTITGKASIVKPTIQTLTGMARIIQPASPIKLTEEALKERERAEKILQELTI